MKSKALWLIKACVLGEQLGGFLPERPELQSVSRGEAGLPRGPDHTRP